MLSGVKFISRDQVQELNVDASLSLKRKSNYKKGKHLRRKHSHDTSSSDDGYQVRIKKVSGKKNKWDSSDENLSSCSIETGSETDSGHIKRKSESKKKDAKRDKPGNRDAKMSKKRLKAGRKYNSSGEESASTSDYNDDRNDRRPKSDDAMDEQITRKELGLGWMVRPEEKMNTPARAPSEPPPDEHLAEEVVKDNPKELNPYLKDSGSGYPEKLGHVKTGANSLLSSSLVGDGGASWRLKALKHSQQQAAREGRQLSEVVEERWGSLGHLAVSAASHLAAPSRAHLRAIKNRKQNLSDDQETIASNQNKMDSVKNDGRDRMKNVSHRHSEMRSPKVDDSLSWRRQTSKKICSRDSRIVSTAVSSLNKFSNDGSFMRQFMHQEKADSSNSLGSSPTFFAEKLEAKSLLSEADANTDGNSVLNQTLNANQLAAKALQLRLKGRHEESDKLLRDAESMKGNQISGEKLTRQQNEARSRFARQGRAGGKEEPNSDAYLGEWIMKNKQYNVANQADDEYDFDAAPSRKSRKKREDDKLEEKSKFSKRILTQKERCQFCFENPDRPRNLVISIANFTYLMLPPWQPVSPGHCYILPLQHESATRTIDDNVWEEIRNFKKCLIMMFAKAEKEPVFLETVMDLAQQRRHCLVECVPLPRDLAKQAPLYFKKAIDEAEDEWSQHNAKRLINTSEKGLRGCIPKGFPYFHVEFGLNNGFVHVIDDERSFKKSFGVDVIRGMLRLPAEDMNGRGRRESVAEQKQAVASFGRDWEPFDWTKKLG